MAELVGIRPLITDAQVQSQGSPWGICGWWTSGHWDMFFHVYYDFPASVITPVLHTCSVICH